MARRKLVALLCLGLMVSALARTASKGQRDLMPSRVRAGSVLVDDLRRSLASIDSNTRSVDLVFVSRHCSICRALVATLERTRRQPPDNRSVVLLTDESWPELEALRSPRIRLVIGDSGAARIMGLRATPTLVTFDNRTARIERIAVGAPVVDERFMRTAALKP